MIGDTRIVLRFPDNTIREAEGELAIMALYRQLLKEWPVGTEYEVLEEEIVLDDEMKALLESFS